MSERKISIKQKMVLECIEWFTNENGYSPTYRELANELDCAIGTVFDKVSILISKGYISCSNGKSRTLKVIKKYD
jgi:SOS-response transcriptional repressor LexA